MGRDIVYFDLETQRTANDVGGWDKKRDMGISLAVTYSTLLGEYRIYSEKELDLLVNQLLRADLVVGYNVINFDYEVLMGYTIIDLPHQCRTLDLLVEIGKTGDGLDAIKWWREKKMLQIAEYCCFDVKCTKLVHEYGAQHRRVHYFDKQKQKKAVGVDWTMEC
jgi:hypothetical protein